MSSIPQNRSPVSLPISTVRKVRAHIETHEGRHTTRSFVIIRDAGEPESVTRQKATNEFRRLFGYADRIVSIDIFADA